MCIRDRLKTSNIQLRRELSTTSPIVHGVEYTLQQVFLHLFLNARDAMPDGGCLSVRSRVEREWAVIEVVDTGIGIADADLSRIYDPFFTTKVVGQGTGLGLSITYGVIKEHQGRIECQSRPGEGTRFLVSLPLHAQAQM